MGQEATNNKGRVCGARRTATAPRAASVMGKVGACDAGDPGWAATGAFAARMGVHAGAAAEAPTSDRELLRRKAAG